MILLYVLFMLLMLILMVFGIYLLFWGGGGVLGLFLIITVLLAAYVTGALFDKN